MKTFYVRFVRRSSCRGEYTEANHSSFQQAVSPLAALRAAIGAYCDDIGYDSSNPKDFDAISDSVMDVMITETRPFA